MKQTSLGLNLSTKSMRPAMPYAQIGCKRETAVQDGLQQLMQQVLDQMVQH